MKRRLRLPRRVPSVSIPRALPSLRIGSRRRWNCPPTSPVPTAGSSSATGSGAARSATNRRSGGWRATVSVSRSSPPTSENSVPTRRSSTRCSRRSRPTSTGSTPIRSTRSCTNTSARRSTWEGGRSACYSLPRDPTTHLPVGRLLTAPWPSPTTISTCSTLTGPSSTREWSYTRGVFDRVSDRLAPLSDREAYVLWHGLGAPAATPPRSGIDPDAFWPAFHAEEDPDARAEATYLHDDAARLLDRVDDTGGGDRARHPLPAVPRRARARPT